MPDNDSVFRKPLRVVKWLGYNVLEQHPLARMLHEARAAEAAKDKSLPLVERRSYQIRQQRVYARGREPVNADAIAAPPTAANEADQAAVPSPSMAPAPPGPVIETTTPSTEQHVPDFLLEERAERLLNDSDD
jgi:hypothetical protein